VLGLIAVSVLGTQLLMLHYQSRAGRMIDDYIFQQGDEFEDQFACLLPLMIDVPDSPNHELMKAVELLSRASGLSPWNAHANYLKGRAYCLQGDLTSAVEALHRYHQQRPGNPLGSMELAFAYFAWAESVEDEKVRDEYIGTSKVLLQDAGIKPEMILNRANTAFDKQNYRTSWMWYENVGAFTGLSEDLVFRHSILSMVFIPEKGLSDLGDTAQEVTPEDITILLPSAFFYLSDGEPVNVQEQNGISVARFFKNTDTGSVLINVKKTAKYCINVNLLDRKPVPTKIAVAADFNHLMTIQLTAGDETVVSVSKDIWLSKGVHLISVNLRNAGRDNGVYRNANVISIEITNCN